MHLEKDAYLIVSSLNTHGLTLPKMMVYVYCKYSGHNFRLIRESLGFIFKSIKIECLKRVKIYSMIYSKCFIVLKLYVIHKVEA